MENLDATIVTPAIPAMAKSFGTAPVDLSAGVSAYMLALAVFIPASGWMADRFGSRLIFSAAICIFTIASLFCGMTHSLWQFVGLRILQGSGGALMVPVGRLVILKNTPKDKLIGAIAMLTWPALVSPVLGPPIGGFITTYATWRWIFYLNVPLGAFALSAARRLIPDDISQEREPFDYWGFVLTGASLSCLMSGIEHLIQPGAGWTLIATLMIGGVVLLAAGIWHLRRSSNPMLDLSLLEIQTFAATVFGGSLFRMSVSAVPFLLPLMFESGFGFDAFHAGLMVIAVFSGNLVIKPLTTPILRHFGFRNILIGNGILNFLAISSCAFLPRGGPLWVTVVILLTGGMVRSMQFTALMSLAFADVPQARMSRANTLFSVASQLSLGLGIALGAGAIHAGEWLTMVSGIAATPSSSFRAAFIIVALISLVGLYDAAKLVPGVGEHVSRKLAAPR